MGADLYLRSVIEPIRAKFTPLFEEACRDRAAAQDSVALAAAQKRVSEYYDALYPDEGYFRDSYNATSVMQVIGLSWWQDVIPMLKDGELPIDRAKELLALIEARPITEQSFAPFYAERLTGADEPLAEWLKYFIEKREALMTFLKKSIDSNEPIDCSL